VSRFVFLDRDGTLVEDPGYVHRLEDFRLLPGTAKALLRLREAGFRLVIVTNQSGIGRGLFREADFQRFQQRLLDELAAAGVTIEATYFCPHAPDAGCDCRKPAAGLLERARRELGADLAHSWVIGDAARDVEMARRAGCAGAVRLGEPGISDLEAAVSRVLAATAP
jgi:histidinol-phosphate phosphatase family protein